jgi:hypothetical protein
MNPARPRRAAAGARARREPQSSENGDQTMMKLYSVTSKATEYHGCKEVPFVWFREGERPGPQRPSAALIKDYDPADDHRFYVEDYIEELFTEDEARQVKDFLDSRYGPDATTTITEVSFPVSNNIMGVGAIPVGGGDDFYMLSKVADYPLPFSVWGYFDLVGCELADGSDVYPHRLMLVGRDGVRMQTNEEARTDEERWASMTDEERRKADEECPF